MQPAKPATAPERANTSIFCTVRFTPMVAEAAGLSDMAIQRRANRPRRISMKPSMNEAEHGGEEDHERLAVAGVGAHAGSRTA